MFTICFIGPFPPLLLPFLQIMGAPHHPAFTTLSNRDIITGAVYFPLALAVSGLAGKLRHFPCELDHGGYSGPGWCVFVCGALWISLGIGYQPYTPYRDPLCVAILLMAIINGEYTAVFVLHTVLVYASLVLAFLHITARDGGYIKEKTHDAMMVFLLYVAMSIIISVIATVIIIIPNNFSVYSFLIFTIREVYLVNSWFPVVVWVKGVAQWIMLGYMTRALLV
jgi:hypothetical protein